MTNPTSNFGWQMPTSTDLVTDLPADFEVFGQAVDTDFVDLLGGTTGQVLSKTSATDLDFTWVTANPGDITGVTAGTGISGGGTSGTVTVSIDTAVTADLTTSQTLTNKTLTSPALTTPTISTLTTNGDILYGSGSGAIARLGIGSSAQVLTVAGGVPSWATPASGGGMTLLSTTTLSGTSTVVSSISGSYKNLYVLVYGVTNDTADGTFFWRPNNTANLGCYRYPNGDTTFSASFGGDIFFNTASLNYQSSSTSNSQQIVINDYASSTAYKPFTQTGLFKVTDGTDAAGTYALGGIKTTSAITSIGFHKGGGGSFTAGTVKIYGVN
jgi:hypothetical protein